MRRSCLLLERQALAHAEAVLFVDDGEAEAMKHDVVFDQRVGANHHRCFAAGDKLRHRSLVLFLQTACHPGHPDAKGHKPAGKLAIVLLGENFGRGHQCRLIAVLRRLQHRQPSDNGLAAADVTL